MPSNMTEKAVSTRIPLLERDQVCLEIATIYDALLKQRGVVPNMFKTLAHTPALAQGIAGFLKSLLGDSALPGWYKELVATRLSVLHNSQYAISAHALSAKQKGATDFQTVGHERRRCALGLRACERTGAPRPLHHSPRTWRARLPSR